MYREVECESRTLNAFSIGFVDLAAEINRDAIFVAFVSVLYCRTLFVHDVALSH